MSKRLDPEDFVAAGFHRLDPTAMELRAPKIAWGRLYQQQGPAEKIRYLEKLAATMNHAAAQIQAERDQLAALCEKKERQLETLAAAVAQNNAMLQSEVTRMNAERQGLHAELARLNAEVRRLCPSA